MSKITSNLQLKRALQTIGKRCFRNCYEVAVRRGDDLTKSDLLRHDEELIGTTEKGLATRLYSIKKIVRSGSAVTNQALEMAKNAKNYRRF